MDNAREDARLQKKSRTRLQADARRLARRFSRLTAGLRDLQLADRDRVQQRAQLGAALLPEYRLKPRLSFHPAFDRGAEPRGPGIGQANLPAPPIGASLDDGHKVNHPGVAHALTEEVFKIDTLAGNGGDYSNFLAAYLGETQGYANNPEYLGNVG